MPRHKMRLDLDDPGLLAGFARIRAEADLPTAYPPDALAELGGPVAAAERADMRDLPLITLDPAGSMDLDQAMHLERNGAGYVVHYAIADVAAFVRPGGALDSETHRRALTVYCPDERVPLHPTPLCEGAGSLLPGKERPAVLWRIALDAEGAVTGAEVRRAVVRSRSRHAYDRAQREMEARDVDVDRPWALLEEIGRLRLAQERARGGVSLAVPEQIVVRGRRGWRVEFRAAAPIERYNAEISLLTGMVAARMMLDGGIGVLRTMPPAPADRMDWLRARARALGIDWPAERTYGEVLDGVDAATPEGAAFLTAAASLFRGAAWTPFAGRAPEQAAHAAIGAPYAHVTAPLRRLVDRYGTEVCLALCAGDAVPEWVTQALEGLAPTMAAGARRDANVDRRCTDLVEAMILADHVGEEFDAVAVTETTVQIAHPAVLATCRVPREAPLAPGHRVRVRLVEADPARPRVAFERVEVAPVEEAAVGTAEAKGEPVGFEEAGEPERP